MKIIILILLFLLTSQTMFAKVYTLRDVFRRRPAKKQDYPENYKKGRLRELLHFEALFKEDISINGMDGSLDVGLIDYTYNDFLKNLQYIDTGRIAVNPNNTVILLDNMRYLVYNTGEFSNAVCFAFNVPYRRNPPPLPYRIPDPGNGSRHTKTVAFPDRGSLYATFENVYNADDAFANCKSQLNSRGVNLIGGTGNDRAGFFMTPDGRTIVLVSFDEQHNNGFVYYSERKK